MVRGPFFLWYGLVVVLAAAGLSLYATLDAPQSWAMLALAVVSIAAGTHYLCLAHPSYRFYLQRPGTFAYWVPPLAVGLGGALFTREFLGGVFILLGLGGTGIATAVLLYCQHLLARPDGAPPPFARLATNLSIYLGAFLIFVSLQNIELAQHVRIASLGLASAILSFTLFRDRPLEQEKPASLERQVLYAGVAGLIIIELAWALQWVPVGRVITGLLLLVCFYLVSGLIHSHLLSRLNRGVVLEFVSVSAVALIVLFTFNAARG